MADIAIQQTKTTDTDVSSASDDDALLKEILATHHDHRLDGSEFDVKPILLIVEDVVLRSTPTISGIVHGNQGQILDVLDDKTVRILRPLANTINKISFEISCKCYGGEDAHKATLAILKTLSSYAWDAKAAIALAAFAVNYGEYWLAAQFYPTNPLAKSIAFLKQLPDILQIADSSNDKYEALTSVGNLINAMLEVARCIIEFKEPPLEYIDPGAMSKANAQIIPMAVYRTIRSIVACISRIMNLVGLVHEASTTKANVELSHLEHIQRELKGQLDLCYEYIEEKKIIEACQTLVFLFERSTTGRDNLKPLNLLIQAKKDQLIHCPTRKSANINVLRKKTVLLFISTLEVSRVEELWFLHQMYKESRQDATTGEGQYEVVWLPVVDKSTPWNNEMQEKFEERLALQPWYSLAHPTLLDPPVIMFIKDHWKFNKKPILVVLDPLNGKVVNNNAFHMIWIWGIVLASPFTSSRENELWEEKTWTIELLVDSIEPILSWINDGKYICLYGGGSKEWISEFTETLNSVAKAANIKFETFYMGKSEPGDEDKNKKKLIGDKNLGHIPEDFIWFFWERLQSMWHSKSKSAKHDSIMQEISTMISFHGSEQGWALISKGTSDMAKGKGDIMLKSLTHYDLWKESVPSVGFVPALNHHLLHSGLYTDMHHCNRIILPESAASLPAERAVCAECGRPMDTYIMYSCCSDHSKLGIINHA
ncbi:protein SIEVE ELEMENT OCCLUSION B-like [Cornus florida]|uniref:protein SIEVE ELEMENT OCCLUSION B-like n=1 Tax=Cornus florida TaxID=4283 RepID=UPI002897F7B0|nr:protein SIEVE ELEMENT OCCLUSION B-like [Cornus florida]